MYATFIIDFISMLLLLGTFYLLWKESTHFNSLKPLLPAIVFLSISHICNMLVEHPSIKLSNLFGLSPESFDILFAVLGNVTDVIGISILIYGFIKIIKFEAAEEKRIKDLETMLPLCANCKRYRTDEGKWLPIEKYLIDNGAPRLTHGICPECTNELYGDILHKKKSNR